MYLCFVTLRQSQEKKGSCYHGMHVFLLCVYNQAYVPGISRNRSSHMIIYSMFYNSRVSVV